MLIGHPVFFVLLVAVLAPLLAIAGAILQRLAAPRPEAGKQ